MYDTIIIGRDPSSWVAALTSIRNNRKTALIMEGDPAMMHRDSGYSFPLDPRPFSGIVDQQIFSRFLGNMLPACGDLSTDSRPVDPAFQVILPGHRVDFFQNCERLIHDLVREFPGQEREINRFYRAVSKVGSLVERWIMEDETRRPGVIGNLFHRLTRFPAAVIGHSALVMSCKGKGEPFKRVIEAQLNFLSHLESDSESLPLSAAYLLSRPVRGIFSPYGGMITWMNRLRRAFVERGGILLDGCSVIRVDTGKDVTVDLLLGQSSPTLCGKKLIVSAQWEKLELLLPARKILPGLNRHFFSIRPSAYPFCLHMGVHEGGLPESMASHVIVVRNGTAELTNRDLVFLQTSPPDETDYAPKGRRAVLATVYLADSPLRLSDQQLKDAAMGIIHSLDDFLPFLRDNIDYLRLEQSIHLSRRYQEVVSRKYRIRRRPFFGMRTLSPRTRIPNVLLTGSILRAGFGFEGEIIAGMDAAFRA